MQNKTKRIMSLLLSLTMLLSVIPVNIGIVYAAIPQSDYMTVAEARELPDGEKVTVKGYIYEGYNTHHALIISDSMEGVSVGENTLRVRMQGDEMKDEFSPVYNPEVIGKQVIITGTRGNYNTGTDEEKKGLIGNDIEIEWYEEGDDTEYPYEIDANPAPGEVEIGTRVSLTTSSAITFDAPTTTPGAVEIRYTLDGDIPDEDSSVYGSSIRIDEDTTVKAVAYQDGERVSKVHTFEYTIPREIISIADFKAQASSESQTIEGVVTHTPGDFGSSNGFYIQDETAGIFVYHNGGISPLPEPGDLIQITGKYGTYGGVTQIQGSDHEVIATGKDLPDPVEIELEGLDASNEGRLVQVEDVQVESITTDTYDNATLTVSYDGVEGIVYLDSRTGYTGTQLKQEISEGDVIPAVVGINQGYQVEGEQEYRIAVRGLEDLGIEDTDTPDEPDEPDEIDEILTVSQARGVSQGTKVTVVGYIREGYNQHHGLVIADQPGGSGEDNNTLRVRLNGDDMKNEFSPEKNTDAVGQQVTITGTRTQYDSGPSIGGSSYTSISIEWSDELDIFTSLQPGKVDEGDKVELSSNPEGATIYYTTDGSTPTTDSTEYTTSIEITGDTVIKAIAVDGQGETSRVVTFNYRTEDEVLTIKEVLELPAGTEDVIVRGQIAYFATDFGNPVIQEEIDGEVYSLYLFSTPIEGAKVGDWVEATGEYTVRFNQPQLQNGTGKITDDTDTAPEPLVVTIDEIKNSNANMINRFVKIENVTLGEYDVDRYTELNDGTGTINIYDATPYPIQVEPGDVVDIYASVGTYYNTRQLQIGTPEHNGFNVYDVIDDTKPPVIFLPDSFLDARVGQDYKIEVEVLDNKGVDTVELTYTIGNDETTVKMVSGHLPGKYEYIIPGEQIVATEESFTFSIIATDVSNLTSKSETVEITINDNPQVVAVTPARGSATDEDKTPEISVTLENSGEAPIVILNLYQGSIPVIEEQAMTVKADEEALIYAFTPVEDLADGRHTAEVTIIRKEDGKSHTESWNFTIGTSEYMPYFGQLHAHTNVSDGSGTVADALTYFRDQSSKDNLDFLALTDHSNYFDTTSAANPAGALNDIDLMTPASREIWETYLDEMRTFNEEHAGQLVAIPGFEMTWSGGPGHINTFYSEGLISRNDSDLNQKTSDAGMRLYYDTLIENTDPLANLSQFNHPGDTFGTFNDFAYWNPAYDNKMVAIEVGNGEGAIGSGGYFPSYQYYTMALDKGWHVGPTNNQDNHRGSWGNSNTARSVVITDELSEEGIMRGMANYAMYATEDENLNINYMVNDQMIGSTIEEVPDVLRFDIQIDDPDDDDIISKVEVITNGGRIAASQNFSSNSINWSFELPAQEGYYYLRVTQADQDIAVTAPIWIGESLVLGIAEVDVDVTMPVTGEELTISTTLFNNEESDAVLKSITYKHGDDILGQATPGVVIGSMETAKYDFKYTPKVAGLMTVDVIAVLTLDGVDHEFTARIELDIRDDKDLVYLGIDASHYNEYVDGNYKDSMGNFAQVAETHNVRVVLLETEEDLLAAMQNPRYQGMIFTPPTRRDGTAFKIGYKSYSQDVVDAVGEFAALGKTVVVTNWSDAYENYDKYTDGTLHTLEPEDHMAAQQNALLESMGARLRVSDDGVVDNVQNGGQAQRLYLTEYNMENEFLQGVDASRQEYSSYGGSTIYATDENGEATSVLPENVVPMVYGFETTESIEQDGDDFAGVDIPKYDNKYMVAASETITHANGNESTVIVAGSAFMSNFELNSVMNVNDYSDSEMNSVHTNSYNNYDSCTGSCCNPEEFTDTIYYSNNNIADNLARSLNPSVISDIADVQAAEEGVRFTVQGIATSNASGYDQDTAFFDTIYIQDETAGINVFPVSGNIQAGQMVEVTGVTDSYQGERQIAVESIRVIDHSVSELPEPIKVTTKEASQAAHLGSLVTVTGEVTSFTAPNNVVESIMVKDESGVEGRIFIDGYITSDKVIENLEVGAIVTATGLSSITTDGPRIRVRDRADVVATPAPEELEVVAMPGSGEVEAGTQVTLMTSEGATIYYTVDGSEPTSESTEYTAPIVVEEDTTIKAIAVNGDKVSEIYVFNYTVEEEVEEEEAVIEVKSFTVSDTNPRRSQKITISLELENIGNSISNELRLKFYMSKDNKDYMIKQVKVDPIEAGETVEVTVEYTATQLGENIISVEEEQLGWLASETITVRSTSTGSGGGSSTTPPTDEDDIDTDTDTDTDTGTEDKGDTTGSVEIDFDDVLQGEQETVVIGSEDANLNLGESTLKEIAQIAQDGTVAVNVGVIDEQKQQEIIENLGDVKEKGLDTVSEVAYEFNITVEREDETTEEVTFFNNPVAITLSVEDLDLEGMDINMLTGIRYDVDEEGNIVPVKLAGEYDEATGTITFYTDQPGTFTVGAATEMTTIDMTIGDTNTAVDGQEAQSSIAPQIVEGRTMMPLRFVAEALGADVDWDNDTKTIALEVDGQELMMTIGEEIPGYGVGPMLQDDTTLVPMRYIAEEFNANVMWFEDEKQVKIVK